MKDMETTVMAVATMESGFIETPFDYLGMRLKDRRQAMTRILQQPYASVKREGLPTFVLHLQ